MKRFTKMYISIFIVLVNKIGLQGFESNTNTRKATASLCRCAERVTRIESRAIVLHNVKQTRLVYCCKRDQRCRNGNLSSDEVLNKVSLVSLSL
jgi:hypothetical protein